MDRTRPWGPQRPIPEYRYLRVEQLQTRIVCSLNVTEDATDLTVSDCAEGTTFLVLKGHWPAVGTVALKRFKRFSTKGVLYGVRVCFHV